MICPVFGPTFQELINAAIGNLERGSGVCHRPAGQQVLPIPRLYRLHRHDQLIRSRIKNAVLTANRHIVDTHHFIVGSLKHLERLSRRVHQTAVKANRSIQPESSSRIDARIRIKKLDLHLIAKRQAIILHECLRCQTYLTARGILFFTDIASLTDISLPIVKRHQQTSLIGSRNRLTLPPDSL